jgi:DNA-binding NarL/FixJ family response regulator
MDQGHDIGVLIVDGDLARLAFLITRLEYEPDLRVVGYATDATDAMELATGLAPDVILSDLDLPDAEGPGQIGIWRRLNPAAGIVIYTARWSESLERQARLNGADECLDKSVPPSELVAAVRDSLSRRRSSVVA